MALLTASGLAIAMDRAPVPSTSGQDATTAELYKDDILKRMRPALESAGGTSRLYYSIPCKDGEHIIGFPKLRLRLGSHKKTGVAAVQDLFANDKNVTVSKASSGIVRITVGNASRNLLNTRIRLLKLKPHERYNPIAALLAIEANESVEEAARKLGLQLPTMVVSEHQVDPAAGIPHLPAVLRDLTLDQALDAVARTFKGLVIYGECEGDGRSRFFIIDFAWVVQLYAREGCEEKRLRTGR